jgi:hypothetical protein
MKPRNKTLCRLLKERESAIKNLEAKVPVFFWTLAPAVEFSAFVRGR